MSSGQYRHAYLWNDDETDEKHADADVHEENPAQEGEVGGHCGAEVRLYTLDGLLPWHC